MSLAGRIGRRRALLWRSADDRLLLRWQRRTFDLDSAVVRHRDEDGLVEFSVGGATARYRRPGPSGLDRFWDALDFTADEPWTWEDRDFGLRVFHIATGTGPVKYRHRIESRRQDAMEVTQTITDAEYVRAWTGGRTERVRFDELDEVRVKFELAGIWSDAAMLVLSTPGDLALFPVGFEHKVQRCRSDLLPRLRRLPGWDAAADAAVEDACSYGTRQQVGPARGESWRSRAERPVWRRPR